MENLKPSPHSPHPPPLPPLPPTPQIKGGKMVRFCPSRGFILDFGGDGGLLFHFILPKIVACIEMNSLLLW